jgi:hypothetical protein
MDPLAGIVARRNEDIALDLMKFIAATTNVGKTVASAGWRISPRTMPAICWSFIPAAWKRLTVRNNKT